MLIFMYEYSFLKPFSLYFFKTLFFIIMLFQQDIVNFFNTLQKLLMFKPKCKKNKKQKKKTKKQNKK